MGEGGGFSWGGVEGWGEKAHNCHWTIKNFFFLNPRCWLKISSEKQGWESWEKICIIIVIKISDRFELVNNVLIIYINACYMQVHFLNPLFAVLLLYLYKKIEKRAHSHPTWVLQWFLSQWKNLQATIQKKNF